jgi:predicted TPR repeat methyltransferase
MSQGNQGSRAEKLHAMLAQTPDDPFLLYALAMEMKKTDSAAALELLERTIAIDPKQCYAYFQLGQTHESAGDVDSAKSAYRRGIAAADKYGDDHAKQEILGALTMLE